MEEIAAGGQDGAAAYGDTAIAELTVVCILLPPTPFAFFFATRLTWLTAGAITAPRRVCRDRRSTIDRLSRDELGYCGSTDTANRRQH
jgi:hypothetical protein